MIISHKYKFIFLHSRRTAGNSFSIYYNHFSGPHDIIVEQWHEIIPRGGKPNQEAVSRLLTNLGNFQFLKNAPKTAFKNGFRKDRLTAELLQLSNRVTFRGDEKLGPRPTHASAKKVADLFPEEFNNYFKFAFFRDPFQYVLSDFHKKHSRLKQKGITFDGYLKCMADPERECPRVRPTPRTNIDVYTFGRNVLAVDYLGSYGTLTEDLNYICQRVGLPFRKSDFPHAQNTKSGTKKHRWSTEQIELVEAGFSDELSFLRDFGYLS
ncbi:sulfotransferase family 2 domain-containing protein [Halorhodospira sp. 9622]|uniref:sulfotransferase family 2 domain-containing protein n=1 Tax=Halorhodospira sp. 9622 TaxID=2899136 RepID=UPI001EE894CF|nr:sulfotransferase family 2 domain-containing protein [Halorhodospira sp. 9622]MCG5539497.1 sulfotransferase family protein [Halorhodospira sp. 9622]